MVCLLPTSPLVPRIEADLLTEARSCRAHSLRANSDSLPTRLAMRDCSCSAICQIFGGKNFEILKKQIGVLPACINVVLAQPLVLTDFSDRFL